MGGAMPASGASSSGTGGSVGDSGGERNGAGGRADGSGGKPPVLLKNYLPCEVELIIGPRCRNCHTPGRVGQEPFFDSYAQVRAERASILDVISDDFMPMLPPALTEEQKDALKTWVDDGAPPLSLSAAPDCGE